MNIDDYAVGPAYVRTYYPGHRPPPASPPADGAVWSIVEEMWVESDDALRTRILKGLGAKSVSRETDSLILKGLGAKSVSRETDSFIRRAWRWWRFMRRLGPRKDF